MYIVFVKFLRFGEGVEHFAVSLLLGVVLWSFFTEATSMGMRAIVDRGDILRKISFPKYIIVVASTTSAFINLMLNLLVVLVFVIINGVDIQWSILLLPLSIIQLYILALSVAFLLSAVYVKYRDIGHLWEVFLQGLFYATPIIYPLTMLIDNASLGVAKVLMLSPPAQIIQDARYSTISHGGGTTFGLIDNVFIALIPYVLTVALGVFAVYYFRKRQKYFSEQV
jgi:ABC-2 type transport system permease protein